MLSWHSGRIVPQPDGSIDQNDKQTLLGRYGGILWSALIQAEGGSLVSIWRWYDF